MTSWCAAFNDAGVNDAPTRTPTSLRASHSIRIAWSSHVEAAAQATPTAPYCVPAQIAPTMPKLPLIAVTVSIGTWWPVSISVRSADPAQTFTA